MPRHAQLWPGLSSLLFKSGGFRPAFRFDFRASIGLGFRLGFLRGDDLCAFRARKLGVVPGFVNVQERVPGLFCVDTRSRLVKAALLIIGSGSFFGKPAK